MCLEFYFEGAVEEGGDHGVVTTLAGTYSSFRRAYNVVFTHSPFIQRALINSPSRLMPALSPKRHAATFRLSQSAETLRKPMPAKQKLRTAYNASVPIPCRWLCRPTKIVTSACHLNASLERKETFPTTLPSGWSSIARQNVV